MYDFGHFANFAYEFGHCTPIVLCNDVIVHDNEGSLRVRSVPTFHASNHLCLQGANEPLPMLLFGARGQLRYVVLSLTSRIAHCIVGRGGLRVA